MSDRVESVIQCLSCRFKITAHVLLVGLLFALSACSTDDSTGAKKTELEIVSRVPEQDAVNVHLNEKIYVTFGSEINPQTVNPTTFSVLDATGVVNGKLEVNKNQIIFTPKKPFKSLKEYSVTIKTTLKSSSGKSLKTTANYYFNTGLDPSRWYRISNMELGSSEALAVSPNSSKCMLANNENTLGQYWHIQHAPDKDYYVFKNRISDSQVFLAGNLANANCQLISGVESIAGYEWKLIPVAGGFYRMQTKALGSDYSLDADPNLGMFQSMHTADQFWQFDVIEEAGSPRTAN